jgi:hypothetical protein
LPAHLFCRPFADKNLRSLSPQPYQRSFLGCPTFTLCPIPRGSELRLPCWH